MAVVFFDETAVFQVWEVATGKALQRIKLDFESDGFLLHPPGLSADGKRLLTLAGSPDGQSLPPRLIVWDLDTGKRRSQRPHKVEMHDTDRPWLAAHTAFAPDGERVTVWLGDRLGIEEVSTGCLLATLPKGVGRPLVFSPDGRLLAAVHSQPRKNPAEGEDVTGLALIEAVSGEEVLRLEVKAFDDLVFAPDGRVILVADNNGLCVWDVETGTKLHRWKWPESLARKASETGARQVSSAIALPGGRAATGMTEGDILIWDLAPSTWPRRQPAGELSRAKLDSLWSDLVGDVRKAHRGIATLTAAPAQTIPFLDVYLRPGVVDAKPIEKLLADLDGDSFMAREAAARELTRLHYRVEPMLRRALEGKPSLELRRRVQAILAGPKKPLAEDLRTLRAIAVLERIGTPEAQRILEKLAEGAACRETQEAQAALQRLKRR
jgi:WD40 repeat protein